MSQHPGLTYLIDTMHVLLGEHGCAWDKEQTHESLIPYLIEESHELIDAIEDGSRQDLKEELGDVLYQVLFHAVLAEGHPSEPFTLDDVARATAEKMRTRHPHVFAGVAVSGVEEIRANWQARKAVEKTERTSTFDGIPKSLPPLDRARELLERAQKAGLAGQGGGATEPVTSEEVGRALLETVQRAQASGVDPSAALRATLRDLEDGLRLAEASRPATEVKE